MGKDLERYTIDGVGRIYVDGDLWLPSVTTVLSMKPTPDALRRWKENTANHEEITRYKANRGTLIHYDCLNEFAPEDMWSNDEQSSLDELKSDADKWERFSKEREWAADTWDLIKRVTEISKENVIDVETFVTNPEIGYGGQFDMLYHDPVDDETVLADIKTSKACYDKHLTQAVVYKKAVPISVDRMEILRMNPDNKDWEISSSHDWLEDEDQLWSKFVELRRKLEEERIETIREHIREKIENDGLESETD